MISRAALLALVLAAAAPVAPDGALRVGAFSDAEPGDALPPGWEPLTFSGIDAHTRYRLVRHDGTVVVRADSRGAASGLIRRIEIDPAALPVVEWRWRVANVVEGGDVSRRSGDDYAARLYVTFAYDPERAGWLERGRFAALRLVYGEYPPVAALSYIWERRAPVGTVVPNPYTDRTRMIVVESGDAHVGEWRTERRNVARDYARAFGAGPVPGISGVAIMTDTDDTGGEAVAWFGDVTFRPGEAGASEGALLE